MKKIAFPIAALFLFAACQNDPKADKAEVSAAQEVTAPATGNTYNADLAQSTVTWTGTKPTGQHVGEMKLKDGSLTADASGITGGQFTIDMNSLRIMDKDTAGSWKLRGHLMSDDFFTTEKYPTARFQITSVKQGAAAEGGEVLLAGATHTVTGNLTLKDSTKSITFPARIAMTDANITADADFNIDRTQWAIVYHSDNSLGNNFIRPTVNVKLHLVANK